MKKQERIKHMINELEKGEPFIFHRDGSEIIFGVRMQLDKEHDEIEIIKAEFPEQIKYKVIIKK